MRINIGIISALAVTLIWACIPTDDCSDRSNILAPGHSGWLISNCTTSECHTLPVVNHDANTALSDCSSCHGGNGAPVLIDTHTGWKENSCDTSGCHTSLTDHNSSLSLSECSSCHGGNGAPVLTETHTGWKKNNCTPCHTQPITDHEENLALPSCASCHGGNGACAQPWVEWHPKNGCSTYNCHGANHGYENNLDCGKCHFAPAGVFQCTVYK